MKLSLSVNQYELKNQCNDFSIIRCQTRIGNKTIGRYNQ